MIEIERHNQHDIIEFWHGPDVLCTVESSFAPDRDDLVNIRKKTYKVIGRTFTVDHSEEGYLKQVACIINLKELGASK